MRPEQRRVAVADLEGPEVASVAVALLRAHLAGDGEAVEALIDACDCRVLLATMTGLLAGLLVKVLPGGAEQLDEWAVAWQHERRESL